MPAPRRVAIFVDQPDWHARRLRRAFARRGVEAVNLSLKACRFQIGGGVDGLRLPGFESALPDGAFVRCVSAGSFEQVTLRLSLLHALDGLGVAVYNDARAIERCVDKSTTSFLVARAGLPTPACWVSESPAEAQAIVAAEARPGAPLVLKPLFGSQGRGLQLIDDAASLPPPEAVAGVYYLQRYVAVEGEGWRDTRVLVAGGRPIAAMLRHGVKWVTNAYQGARCEAVAATGEPAALAVAAATAVGAGYAGVDVIRADDGRHLVLEINSMPAWHSLQRVSEIDISAILVDDFLSRLPQSRPVGRGPAPMRSVAGG
jgi:RimK family alpha-L-glutamate ligase